MSKKKGLPTLHSIDCKDWYKEINNIFGVYNTMSVLQRLTEGVVTRNVRKEGEALLTKWEQTGLLEGLNDGQQKQGMAVLLENQAKELLP